MAHELDTRENGIASIFSVKETPWHSLGTILKAAPKFIDAMELGGLNFNVDLRPMKALVPVNDSGDTIEVDVPENFAVVRDDRKSVLGVVGPSYRVLQNAEAFGVLEPLLDAGLASLETGGTLREGRDVWMMVRFNIDDAKVREVFGKEVVPFGLISNNHNGSRKVVLQETPIRVVCANTLGMALGAKGAKAITVRHTANVKVNVVDAAKELFATLTTRYVTIANQYEALKLMRLTERKFEKLVLDVVAPLPEAPTGERATKNKIATAAYDRALARAEEKRSSLTELWTAGDGHTGDHSAWEAYNAVTQSVDHDGEMWKAGNRLEALFDGGLADTKQKALESLFAATK